MSPWNKTPCSLECLVAVILASKPVQKYLGFNLLQETVLPTSVKCRTMRTWNTFMLPLQCKKESKYMAPNLRLCRHEVHDGGSQQRYAIDGWSSFAKLIYQAQRPAWMPRQHWPHLIKIACKWGQLWRHALNCRDASEYSDKLPSGLIWPSQQIQMFTKPVSKTNDRFVAWQPTSNMSQVHHDSNLL